jgi:cyclase
MRPRVIPVLLLRGDGLVKGVKFRSHQYVGDPINAVKIFNEKEVDELVFLDISATRQRRIPKLDVIQKIADECYMPFAVGGGVSTIEQMREIIHAGAEKLVINTAAVDQPDLIERAADRFGSQAVIVSIDARRRRWGRSGYEALTRSGRQRVRQDPVSLAQRAETLGAGEILLTSIDRDGTTSGYELELVSDVAAAVSVPVIACGGAGTLDDMVTVVEKADATAVAAGSLFVFYGRRRAVLINYPTLPELDSAFGAAGCRNSGGSIS